jgi:hypothetical protein
MSAPKRAFALYECDEGWCIEPLENSIGTLRTRQERKNVAAFSTLSRALWWLPRNLQAWQKPAPPRETDNERA